MWGFSKWHYNDGRWEWKRCRVLGYVAEQERFRVLWDTGREKMVGRVNLRFEGESPELFAKKF